MNDLKALTETKINIWLCEAENMPMGASDILSLELISTQ